MATGPWYISAAAVRDYLAIMQRPAVDDGPEWVRAEAELIELAKHVVASAQTPRRSEQSGYLTWRGPKPMRLYLVVSERPNPEGPLPQLIAVRFRGENPDRPGRRGRRGRGEG